MRPRSGLALKYGVTVLNAPGTIDSDYRGEVGVILINHGDATFEIARGERIAQLVFAPVVQAPLVEARSVATRARRRRLWLDRSEITANHIVDKICRL